LKLVTQGGELSAPKTIGVILNEIGNVTGSGDVTESRWERVHGRLRLGATVSLSSTPERHLRLLPLVAILLQWIVGGRREEQSKGVEI
jgi:hypothetical protein